MKNPPLEEGRMEEREKQINQSDNLLSGIDPGKEELLIGKQLHERIGEMFRSGRKKKEIARLLGVDIKTVRKITKGESWKPYVRTTKQEGVLDPWKEWVTKRSPEVGYNVRVLFRELGEQGYRGSYDTVKQFVKPLRTPSCSRDMTVRFETRPGEQAQVDWGSSQVWLGEERVQVRFFVMTLGSSRRMFVKANQNEWLGIIVILFPLLGTLSTRYSLVVEPEHISEFRVFVIKYDARVKQAEGRTNPPLCLWNSSLSIKLNALLRWCRPSCKGREHL